MFDLMTISIIIRAFGVLFPLVTVLLCFQLGIPEKIGIEWFLFILLGGIFVGTLTYGIGALFHVAAVNVRLNERRTDVAERSLRIQEYRSRQQQETKRAALLSKVIESPHDNTRSSLRKS